jgi:hypothetical protein
MTPALGSTRTWLVTGPIGPVRQAVGSTPVEAERAPRR